MSDEFQPYAPPKANLLRPAALDPLLWTARGMPRLRSLLKAAFRIWQAELGTITAILLAM